MECNGDGISKVVDSVEDLVAGSALNASVLNYYKKFGRKRDLEQYFSLSTAQSEIRDPTSLFWRKMKSQSDSDSGEKRSESSNEICRISIKCFAPDEPSSSQDDNKDKEESQSPPIIMEEANTSRNLDDSIKSDDDDRSHKSLDAALDTSTNKPFSPTSSITSQRKLEWDSLADVGYGNETDRKASGSSLSTLERLALKQQYSNNDSQEVKIGVPTAHSTPQEDIDVKPKGKGKTTKFYNRDIERVEVNMPYASTSNQTQAINVNLTKHISFNVDQGGGVTVDNVQKDISIKPCKVSKETEMTPQDKSDKEIQTTLIKSRDKSSSSGDLTNNAPTYGKVLISLNSLRKRHRRKKLKNAQRIFRSKRRVVAEKENIPMHEKSGEQVSEAESFEYMPGHIYNQNQMKHLARPSNAAGNKSSLESSGVLTTDSSKTSKASFKRDLEKSVTLLKLTLKNHEDSDLKQKLIKAIVQRLIKSTYREDESSTEFLSGLSFNNKLLGLSDSNRTTSSASDANATKEKITKPKKSILRHEKFNSSAIASSSQSAPNLPSVSNSENPVTTNLVRQLLTSNTDSDMSSKEKTSSDNAFAKTSSEELYQKYIDALKRETAYKRHLRDKEMFLKQKLVSSDSMLKLPANLDIKSQGRLKDIIKDLTRNNYDDGSGDASKLEGGSSGNLPRLSSSRKLRSHSVFTLSSGNSDYHNRSGSRNQGSGNATKPGPSRANQWYNSNDNHPVDVKNSSVQVNFDSIPSSASINPYRGDYRESRSSQTNVDVKLGCNDRASTSGSSKHHSPSCKANKPKLNVNVWIHEATRSIQTEISINPKISDPSLHDIRIIADEDCVSIVSEHYREKSKSTIPTTDQKDNADDYESVITDGTSGYYNFRVGSSAPTDIEPNPDNYTIPIQGTNMTLMVKLNSNPVQIPNDMGIEMENAYLNENPRRTPSNFSPRNALTKPLVNTLFTRQNFLNEIYPDNDPFHTVPLTPQKRKKCNDVTCPSVKPQYSRHTLAEISEHQMFRNNNPCTDKTCSKNKSSCSDNTCHNMRKICEPRICEQIKFDMGTNTPKPCNEAPPPCEAVQKPTCGAAQKPTCWTASPKNDLRINEPQSIKKASTCTGSPRKPAQQVYDPTEIPSSEHFGAYKSPREPGPKKLGTGCQSSGSQTGTPSNNQRIKYNENCECPESSQCKEGPCGCKKEEPITKSTCGSPRRPKTSASQTEKTSCSPRVKYNEDCECPETSKCKDGPCGCKKDISRASQIDKSCGDKESSSSCSKPPRKVTYNEECECPETSKCKDGPCGCKKDISRASQIDKSCGDKESSSSCSKPPRKVTYNEECECPETSKCKDGPCDCKKDKSCGDKDSRSDYSKPDPKVSYNKDCECPETSKCKDGPCGCKKSQLTTSTCGESPRKPEPKTTSKGCQSQIEKSSCTPRPKYNEECECPDSSKCKEGPCGCKKEPEITSSSGGCLKKSEPKTTSTGCQSQTEKPSCTPRPKYNEECECPDSSKCKEGPCGCKKEPDITTSCGGSLNKPKPKTTSTGCQSQIEKPSCTPRVKYNEECECPETSKCKDGPCGCKKKVYNEECECPKTSKCKDGPCGCKKKVYNEECECPKTSKCKDGPCGCKKEVQDNESCGRPKSSPSDCSQPIVRVVYNKDCECPQSSKCKDGPCNCAKISKCNTYPKEIKITSKNLSMGPSTLPSDCSLPKSIEISCPRLQFKEYLNRLKKYDLPNGCSQAQESRYKSCDTDNTDFSTSKDLILEIIQDITKRYSKKDVAKSERKKCFKEIMTILNYLLNTDDSPDADQLKVLMSTTTQEDCEKKGAICSCCRKRQTGCTDSSSSKCTECGCDMTSEKDVSEIDCKTKGVTKTFCRQEVYSVNVEADCACGALLKKNEVCTCRKKQCVDKGVQLSARKLKSCDVKESETSCLPSSDLPCTSSDSATCKVLNKIKKECERFQQKRCVSHHSCRKCDASSSTSATCDCCKCRRIHHCYCKSHKCRGHRHKADKFKKKCVAYNLIIQTSESMISEGPSHDNNPLKNVVVKVPPSRFCLDMPFKELSNKIEDKMPGRITAKAQGAQRSRSLPNDSISSNDDNMNKVNTYTVREYLERNRPDFLEHTSRRQNCLKMMSESRASEHATKYKLLSMQLQMHQTSPLKKLSEADLRMLAKELGIDSRRKKVSPKFISERDMKKHSEKIYKSLPEVVRKKEEVKKENYKKTNLLMANIFKKNLLKKTLSGDVNLPSRSPVVKI